jgi:hypothetical protein
MSLKYTLSIIFFVLIVLIGCTPNTAEQQVNIVNEISMPTETLIITPTQKNKYRTPVPTLTLENTFRTPVPTLSNNVEQKMIESLESSQCILPCYMGITPGITKIGDAKILLESFGAKFQAQGTQDNLKWIDYLIRIDDPSIIMASGAVEDERISYSIALITDNDVVERMRIWILGKGISPKFQNYWSRYTPKGVFLQIGAPDAIYSSGHGGLVLVYEQLGIINKYDTFWKDGQLCPQNETIYFDRRFQITKKDASTALSSEFAESSKDTAILHPIEESLGISIQEFYEQVISDDSVCFDITN